MGKRQYNKVIGVMVPKHIFQALEVKEGDMHGRFAAYAHESALMFAKRIQALLEETDTTITRENIQKMVADKDDVASELESILGKPSGSVNLGRLYADALLWRLAQEGEYKPSEALSNMPARKKRR